jgi:membrane-bound metal-dependent hydrolase YbcI (DUF457 family)
MAYTGFNALLGLSLKSKRKLKSGFYTSFLIGLFVPDLDWMFVSFSLFISDFQLGLEKYHQTFSHSFFTILIIYLFALIISEIRKNSFIRTIGIGISTGMLLHITIDTFLSLQNISLLWPLPLGPYSLYSINLDPVTSQLIMSAEFIFFRFYGWFLIKEYLRFPDTFGWFVKYITKWMKIELCFAVTLIIWALMEFNYFYAVFLLMYVPSVIFAIIATLLMYKSLEMRSIK